MYVVRGGHEWPALQHDGRRGAMPYGDAFQQG
ncbi:MAG: hypothetical protein ACJAZO_003485, partial [Myxococcota bacterium]